MRPSENIPLPPLHNKRQRYWLWLRLKTVSDLIQLAHRRSTRGVVSRGLNTLVFWEQWPFDHGWHGRKEPDKVLVSSVSSKGQSCIEGTSTSGLVLWSSPAGPGPQCPSPLPSPSPSPRRSLFSCPSRIPRMQGENVPWTGRQKQ